MRVFYVLTGRLTTETIEPHSLTTFMKSCLPSNAEPRTASFVEISGHICKRITHEIMAWFPNYAKYKSVSVYDTRA